MRPGSPVAVQRGIQRSADCLPWLRFVTPPGFDWSASRPRPQGAAVDRVEADREAQRAESPPGQLGSRAQSSRQADVAVLASRESSLNRLTRSHVAPVPDSLFAPCGRVHADDDDPLAEAQLMAVAQASLNGPCGVATRHHRRPPQPVLDRKHR